MSSHVPAELVNALRCAAAASPDYGATMIEAAEEIERERTKRLQAQHELACAIERIADMCVRLREAIDIIRPHATGDEWKWIREVESEIATDDVPVVQEARPIARCDACERVADNKMAGQRCFMEDADGAICGGTLLTVR